MREERRNNNALTPNCLVSNTHARSESILRFQIVVITRGNTERDSLFRCSGQTLVVIFYDSKQQSHNREPVAYNTHKPLPMSSVNLES